MSSGFMVRHVSRAHRWILAANHPEASDERSEERVEGLHGPKGHNITDVMSGCATESREKEETTDVSPWKFSISQGRL